MCGLLVCFAVVWVLKNCRRKLFVVVSGGVSLFNIVFGVA